MQRFQATPAVFLRNVKAVTSVLLKVKITDGARFIFKQFTLSYAPTDLSTLIRLGRKAECDIVLPKQTHTKSDYTI